MWSSCYNLCPLMLSLELGSNIYQSRKIEGMKGIVVKREAGWAMIGVFVREGRMLPVRLSRIPEFGSGVWLYAGLVMESNASQELYLVPIFAVWFFILSRTSFHRYRLVRLLENTLRSVIPSSSDSFNSSFTALGIIKILEWLIIFNFYFYSSQKSVSEKSCWNQLF